MKSRQSRKVAAGDCSVGISASTRLPSACVRSLTTVALAGVLIALVAASAVQAATVVVTPTSPDDWAFNTADNTGMPPAVDGTSGGGFVTGPGTPPLGVGSAELFTGNGTVGGDESAQLRNTAYTGTKLSDLTSLKYCTWGTKWNGQQLPYLSLQVDTTGTGAAPDDQIFFEPAYQQPASGNPCLPDQGAPTLNTWQCWDAFAGGWWANNGGGSGTTGCTPGADSPTPSCPYPAGSNPASGVCALADYIAQHPNARILNSTSGLGGVRVNVGFASPNDQFDGNVDKFVIGVSGSETTYDFEPTPTTTTTTTETTTTTAAPTTTTTSVTLPTTTSITLPTTTTTTATTTTTTTTTLVAPIGHLKCYRTTDARARASYTLDLMAGVGGFVNELGCRLRLPAKRICVEVTKTAVQPPPPGGGPTIGPNAGAKFLSYNIRCPRQSVGPIAFHDQFGAGLFSVRTPKELLVPALPGPANSHLKCYKTRDPRPRANYTLTLQAGVAGFNNETGCRLRLRAKEVCVAVTKQNVVPPPPGGGPPAVTSGAKLISYRLKCPAQPLPATNASDQFGPGLFAPRKAAALLVPSSPSGAFLENSSMF